MFEVRLVVVLVRGELPKVLLSSLGNSLGISIGEAALGISDGNCEGESESGSGGGPEFI